MRNKLIGTRRRKTSTAVVALVLIAATAAWAAWTLTNTADFRGKTGELQAITFSAPSSPTGFLLPGGSDNVKVDFNNPNAVPVPITDVNTSTATATGGPGCSSGNFTINHAAFDALVGTSIAPGSGTLTVVNGISLISAAPTTCQNKVVILDPIPITYGLGT